MKQFVKDFTNNIKSLSVKIINTLTPGEETVTGGGYGIIIVGALMLIIPLASMIKYTGIFAGVTIIVVFLLALTLLAELANLILQLAIRIPLLLRLAILGTIPVVIMSFGNNTGTFFFMFSLFILFSFMAGAGIWLILKFGWKEVSPKTRIFIVIALFTGLGGLIGGTAWLLHPGKNIEPPLNYAFLAESLPDKLKLPDPSSAGEYSTVYLTYGSGEDKHRRDYGENTDVISQSVNGSAFLSSWKGIAGKLREWYFGFDKYTLPLNAKVWHPDGTGPFPLVMAVHGNHLAQDWSEGGYAYLGELLASRGFIFVSVDQNFLNGSFTNIFNGLSNENDARAWLLLKHLQQWEEWNSDSLSPFYNMADMNNIALAGHSRGGEAAGHAALFNTLPCYPDDAREIFDFNFNIRSIIAIAPSDRQYEPAGTGTPLKNINYFVLHGSHDADVQSFLGMRQYNRVSFSPEFNGFKSALYIYRANHGQFNTSWGKKDLQSPRINLYNLQQLLTEEDQQKIAIVYISAFLEVTLKGRTDYRPLFMDHRKGREWLPENIYLNQYEQSEMLLISDFMEDLDLTTTSMDGGWIQTENLTLWREETAKIKWGEQETRSATVGWNNSENDYLPARYTFMLPREALTGSDYRMLFITLADSDETPDPETLEPEDTKKHNEREKEAEKKTHTSSPDKEFNQNSCKKNLTVNEVVFEKFNNEENTSILSKPLDNKEIKNNEYIKEGRSPVVSSNENISDKEKEGINFTIELTDYSGSTVSFPLERYYLLQPRLEKQMTKLPFMKTAPVSETVFSFFCFDLDELSGINPEFNPDNIEKISLVFDITEKGVIIINNIGFVHGF